MIYELVTCTLHILWDARRVHDARPGTCRSFGMLLQSEYRSDLVFLLFAFDLQDKNVSPVPVTW